MTTTRLVENSSNTAGILTSSSSSKFSRTAFWVRISWEKSSSLFSIIRISSRWSAGCHTRLAAKTRSVKLTIARRIWKSIRIRSWMPGCWTLTATWRPSISVARWTWAIEALAIGSCSNRRNTCSSGRPSSDSTTVRTPSNGVAVVWSYIFLNSSMNSGGMRSGRVPRSWPILMNVGPRSSMVRRTRYGSVLTCLPSTPTGAFLTSFGGRLP